MSSAEKKMRSLRSRPGTDSIEHRDKSRQPTDDHHGGKQEGRTKHSYTGSKLPVFIYSNGDIANTSISKVFDDPYFIVYQNPSVDKRDSASKIIEALEASVDRETDGEIDKNGHVLVISDTSITSHDSATIARLIKNAIKSGTFDVCHLLRSMDRCDTNKEMVSIDDKTGTSLVKGKYPQGMQAVIFSPSGRDILLGRKYLKSGRMLKIADDLTIQGLGQKMGAEINDGNLSCQCFVPSLISVNPTKANQLGNLGSPAECDLSPPSPGPGSWMGGPAVMPIPQPPPQMFNPGSVTYGGNASSFPVGAATGFGNTFLPPGTGTSNTFGSTSTGFSTAATGLGTGIGNVVTGTGNVLGSAATGLGTGIGNVVTGTGNVLGSAATGIGNVVSGAGSAIGAAATGLGAGISGLANGAASGVANTVSSLTGGPIPGPIPGPTPGPAPEPVKKSSWWGWILAIILIIIIIVLVVLFIKYSGCMTSKVPVS